MEKPKLCFNCIEHFDYAKGGYFLRLSQGFPNRSILKIGFCSENCYFLGMQTNNIHLALVKLKEQQLRNIWLIHPIKCTCEICIYENL